MSTPPLNPTSFRYPFQLSDEATLPEVIAAVRYHSSGILDLNQAITALKPQVDTAQTTANAAVAAATPTSSGVTSFNTLSGNVTYFPRLGMVNDQRGNPTYLTEQTDNGGKIIVADSSPIVITLNASVGAPWFTTIDNDSSSMATLTPSSGSLFGEQTIPGNGFGIVYFDGTNFFCGATSAGGGGGGFTNPMTTAGDLIDGGSGGTPQRLPIGATGDVLRVVAGAPAWATISAGGLFGPILSAIPVRATLGLTTSFNASGTFTQADTAMGITIADPTGTSGENFEGLLKAYPSSPYTLNALVIAPPTGTNFVCVGLVIMLSTTGKLIFFGWRWSNSGNVWQPCVIAYNSPTSFDTFLYSPVLSQVPLVLWYQIVDDGTNITFNISVDGVYQMPVYTVTKASSWLGASGFNFIGFAIDRSNGAVGGTLASWAGA